MGLAVAVPLGPVGFLCLRKSLSQGPMAGFSAGLGAATADALYAAVAGFGITWIADWLLGFKLWLGLGGGLFIIILGIRSLMTVPSLEETQGGSGNGNLMAGLASTFVLTLTNPMTILAFAAIFAGLGLGAGDKSWPAAATMVAGVWSGSVLWWAVVSGLGGIMRGNLGARHFLWINRLVGVGLIALGLVAMGGGLLE